jgi:DNA-binding transcriptional MocR family regulator
MGPKGVTIALSPAAVREFLSQSADLKSWTATDMAKLLGVSRERAEQIVAALAAAGYIERLGGHRAWRNTAAGNAVAGVSKASPVNRTTVEKNLAALLDRIRQVNQDRRFLYRVDQALVFGPFVTTTGPVRAVDVALRLAPSEPDSARREKLIRERAEQAARAGKRFPSFTARMNWGQDEVRNFLKGRARSIALHDLEEWMLGEPHRMVWESPAE